MFLIASQRGPISSSVVVAVLVESSLKLAYPINNRKKYDSFIDPIQIFYLF